MTHKVDDIKRNKIISQGIDTIEIDLSEYKNNIDEEKLKELLLNSDEKKYWIYNNNVETIINRLEKYYKIKVVRHGFAEHTETCPINSRTFKGKSYANVIDDCLYCNKCLKFDDNEVICAAVTPNYNNKSNKNNSKNKCPVCGGTLYLNDGKNGKFYGCSNYPDCTFTINCSNINTCPNCGGKLKLKEGRFGKFYGCERYPRCKYTKNY